MPQIDRVSKLMHDFETIIYNVQTGYNKSIYIRLVFPCREMISFSPHLPFRVLVLFILKLNRQTRLTVAGHIPSIMMLVIQLEKVDS